MRSRLRLAFATLIPQTPASTDLSHNRYLNLVLMTAADEVLAGMLIAAEVEAGSRTCFSAFSQRRITFTCAAVGFYAIFNRVALVQISDSCEEGASVGGGVMNQRLSINGSFATTSIRIG